MPLLYENFLKTTTTNYFEALNASINPLALGSLDREMTLNKIPEKQIYTQGNDFYCIIRIEKFVYSFSFISTSKSNDIINKTSLALTFGLITNPDTLKVKEIFNATKMANYRDTSTKTIVGPKIFQELWRNIISYYLSADVFKQTNKKMSYRGDLEGHEHAVLSNLVDFLKKDLITKDELIDKIIKIRNKIMNSKNYSDVAVDDGKSDFYSFSGSKDFNFEKTKESETVKDREIEKEKNKKIAKNKMNNLLKKFEELVNEQKSEFFNKNDIATLLSKFETKNLIRTGLYTIITKEFFGYRDIKTKIKENIKSISEKTKEINHYLQEIKDTILKECKIIINKNEKSLVDETELEKIIEDIRKILESSTDNNQKIMKIEEIVSDFYSSKIQNFSYLQNRYVLLNI